MGQLAAQANLELLPPAKIKQNKTFLASPSEAKQASWEAGQRSPPHGSGVRGCWERDPTAAELRGAQRGRWSGHSHTRALPISPRSSSGQEESWGQGPSCCLSLLDRMQKHGPLLMGSVPPPQIIAGIDLERPHPTLSSTVLLLPAPEAVNQLKISLEASKASKAPVASGPVRVGPLCHGRRTGDVSSALTFPSPPQSIPSPRLRGDGEEGTRLSHRGREGPCCSIPCFPQGHGVCWHRARSSSGPRTRGHLAPVGSHELWQRGTKDGQLACHHPAGASSCRGSTSCSTEPIRKSGEGLRGPKPAATVPPGCFGTAEDQTLLKKQPLCSRLRYSWL